MQFFRPLNIFILHVTTANKVLGTFSTRCDKIILRRSSTAARIFAKLFFYFTCNHGYKSFAILAQHFRPPDFFFKCNHGFRSVNAVGSKIAQSDFMNAPNAQQLSRASSRHWHYGLNTPPILDRHTDVSLILALRAAKEIVPHCKRRRRHSDWDIASVFDSYEQVGQIDIWLTLSHYVSLYL